MPRFDDRYTFLTLPTTLRLHAVEEPPILPPGVQDRVDRLWIDAQERHGKAFHDGPMWVIDGAALPQQIDAGKIHFRRASYRYHYARMVEPGLDEQMRLRFTGVGGVLKLTDGRLVLGQRSQRVGMDPGLWQLAPTGGLDGRFKAERGTAALVDQLIAEAWEELGIPAQAMGEPRLLGVMIGAERGVHNFMIRADVDLDRAGLQAAFQDRPDPELDRFATIDPVQPEWPIGADFTTASRQMLEMLCAKAPPLAPLTATLPTPQSTLPA